MSAEVPAYFACIAAQGEVCPNFGEVLLEPGPCYLRVALETSQLRKATDVVTFFRDAINSISHHYFESLRRQAGALSWLLL